MHGQQLQLAEVAGAVGGEGKDQASDIGRVAVSRQAVGQQVEAKGRQDKTEQKHQVVGQDGVISESKDGHAEQDVGKEDLRVGQGVRIGVKDVGVEELEGGREKLMGLPVGDPQVEQRIGGVLKGLDQVQGQRIGHQQAQQAKAQQGQEVNPGRVSRAGARFAVFVQLSAWGSLLVHCLSMIS